MWDKESIKQLRQMLNITQTEFAALLGCRQQTISEWEQGLYAPANAYGKLLSQLKTRGPTLTQILKPSPAQDIKLDLESHDERPSERPFDPAID